MSEPMIEVNDVSMCFTMSKEKVDSLKEYFLRKVKKTLLYEEFWALKNVSFSVERGELLGLVGLNGSGKSTMLKLIAGVMKPTKGKITVRGTMAPMIELGAGFDMDLTARENLYLNGAVLGRSRKEMHEKFEEIIEFAELQDFVDIALKNYSSGMVARLAFSIATAVEPDILLVDEILAVGDYKFQKKCKERIYRMVGSGMTVILVSHNHKDVEKLCDRAIWLSHGEVVMYGDARDVCKRYLKQA